MSERGMVPLKDIKADPRAQPRALLDQDLVREYAQLMHEGVPFPPIVVYQDGDLSHWLADGFHRYHAALKAEKTEISAEIRRGTLRDAVLYSAGANATHGKRRSND